MITQIFYSLVLFPYIQYKQDIGNGYSLESIHEKDFGLIECIFLMHGKLRQSVEFLYNNDLDNKESRLKNWLVRSDDVWLREKVIDLINQNQQPDFLFFQEKSFYDSIPFGVVLTITSKCNLFCNYCFNDYDYPLDSRNTRDNIGLQKYKDIVDLLYQAWTRDIILTWWEPFAATFFWDLLEYIRDKWIYVRINTNGTLLTDATLERLNKDFSLTLMVSMHEFNNKDYFDVNQLGARNFWGIDELKWFENKFEKKIWQLKKIINYPNISMDFLTILRPKNIIYLEKLYEFVLSQFQIQDWHFFRLYSTGTTPWISQTLVKIAIYKLSRLNKQYNTNFKFVDSVPFCVVKDLDVAASVIDGELSDSHNVKTIITTDWNIQIMSAFDSNLWSIFENDIISVWRWSFVQKMLNNGFLPKECSDCRYKEKCRWGSRMDANIFNGSYDAFDPLGNIANKIV